MKHKNIIVSLIVVLASTIIFGSMLITSKNALDPYGESIVLPDISKSYVMSPDQSLDLDALNVKELRSKTNVLSESESDFFTAKSTVAVRKLFEGMAQYFTSQGMDDKAKDVELIAKHIDELKTFRRPAHQYKMNKEISNRVLFYGAKNEFDQGPGHTNIDKFVHDVGHPLVKVMTHFSEAQGGTLFNLLESGSGGMTHAGGYIAGWYNGRPVAIRSEWPTDYGVLGDDNVYYNAHLFAIDYQAGTSKRIPDHNLVNYYKNYALWDVFSGLFVPFVSKSKVEEYQDYKNNPLEVYNGKTLGNIAEAIGSLNKEKINFTSYCAEGQWNTMNLAPNYLITKGHYPKIDEFIRTYQSAPDYRAINENERFKFPEIGWKWLHEEKLITEAQYKELLITRRVSIYLDWIDNDTKPWTEYGVGRSDGLIADPMSLGTLVRTLLRTYFPREHVKQVIADALRDVYTEGGDKVKKAVDNFLDGYSPDTFFIGDYVIGEAATKISGLQYALLLSYEPLKEKLFKKLGFEHIVSDEDQLKVETLYEKYIQAILNPDLDTRDKFDSELAKIDAELASLQVEMLVYGPKDTTKRTKKARVRFFMWAPPQAWSFWAQQPDMFNSHAIRYAATAMHYYQSKEYAENEKKE